MRLYKLSVLMFFLGVSILYGQILNIQVNNPQSINPNEVTIAVNPAGPDTLIAGANLYYYYYSHDGGVTWTESTLTDSAYSVWGDPCIVFDADGNSYFGHLSNPRADGYWIDRIVVQKSVDGGINWQQGVGVGYNPPYPRVQDKEWLAVDLTASDYQNNIYMAWTEFDRYGSDSLQHRSRIRFSRSVNQGVTWAPAIVISDADGNCLDGDETTEGAVPAIGPDGEIFIAWSDSSGIQFDRSYDGGQSFGMDVFISTQPGGWAFEIPGIYRCNGMPVTACDVSLSPYRGHVYVMWSDQRNGINDTDIFLSKSTDEGNTWSAPKRVNDDNTQRHQFFPWMSIDPHTGVIYIVFYDRRQTEGDATDVFLARSDNGGESFTNTPISESSFIPDASIFFGDYTNITALNGKIYPIWMRLDNNKFFQRSIWVAPIEDSLLVTGIKDGEIIPGKYVLDQNYPNPFNGRTTINFSIYHPGNVTLKVYDITGKKITSLHQGWLQSGAHTVSFNAENLASGIYFYTLETGSNKALSKKMLLIK